MVKKNSVIQINDNGPEGWIGCLLQVDEVKSWGVLAWVEIPKEGSAYLRLETGRFDYIGEATLKGEDT